MSDELFRHAELAPPAGGLERLQRAVRRRRASRAQPYWWAATAAAMLALVAFGVGLRVRHRAASALGARMIHALYVEPGPSGVDVTNGVAISLPSGRPDVRVYVVQVAEEGGSGGPGRH